MTILVTGDWHLNDNPRDDYRHKFQRKLRGLVEAHQASTVVMLGDLTEAKEGHNAHLVNRIVEELSMLSKLAHVIILKGNHDYVDPACPFFRFLGHLPNVEWVGQPCVLEIDRKRFLFLPYTAKWKTDWNPTFFKTYCKGPIEAVFAHQTFRGAISENGEILDGVHLNVIPKGLPVISGDVHMPQEHGRLTYVGAPYTIRFGDVFEPRILKLKGAIKESIPCPGQQKYLIKAKSIVSAMKQIDRHREDILKVQIDWDGEKIEKWSALRRDLLEWAKERDIQLHGVEAVIEGKTRAKRYEVSRAQSDREIIKAYCKANDVSAVLEGVGQKIAKGDA